MKKLLFTLLLAVCATFCSQAQNKFYESCRSNDNYETVFIGKSMLEMVKSSNLNINGMDLNSIINKIESIQVITTEKSSAAKKLAKSAKTEFNTNKGYNLMMETTDKEDSVVIFTKKLKENTTEYVLLTTSPSDKETSVIIITGSLTPEDLSKIGK